MSGNPFGLSEISHFGSFQRVGGKAGGFINKKFFHPSSMANQEKLWKAQTADERERKKQNELEKRREEERHVEEMRKQLYLAGQGKASDMFVKSGAEDDKVNSADKEQRDLVREQKRRKGLVKAAAEENSDDDNMPSPADGERVLARSRYKEDKLEAGHTAIWGSWFSKEESRWGFGCCKVLGRSTECPLAPEEEPQAEAAHKEEKARGKRKRRGEEEEEKAEEAAPESNGANRAREEIGGLQGSGRAVASQSIGGEDEPLIDMRMLEASERRRQKKKEEDQRKEEAKKSAYLNNLLDHPGVEPQV